MKDSPTMETELNIKLRPAQAEEAREIRRLIYVEKINPMGLDWRRFLVAESDDGEMIGFGQVKEHGDGTRELASIVVRTEYRGRGTASALIRRLIADHPPPLYLSSRAALRPFYERFGFRVLSPAELPPYFKRIWRLYTFLRLVSRPFIRLDGFVVMRRDVGEG